MSEKEVSVAIIGAGNIATRHLANLDFLGGNRIAAVCDRDIERAEAMAKRVGATAYGDAVEMFEKDQFDAVLLCAPPSLRKRVFELAADRGVAVFCEKPPAKDLAEAREITAIVEKTGLTVSVGFNCRYAPSVDHIRELIGGRTINFARCAVISPAALPGRARLDDWFFIKEISGGLMDVLIHSMDLMRYVAGDVELVHVLATNLIRPKAEDFTIEDTISINMQFASGATASVVSSWVCAHGLNDLTFFGEDFALSLTPIPPIVKGKMGKVGEQPQVIDVRFPQGPAMGRSGKISPDRKPEDPPDPPHCEEIKVFLDAVRTGDMSKVRSTYRDAARTMALVDAVNRSIESGTVERVQSV